MLPGVETTVSGAVLEESDVLNNFRDDAFFADEQFVALNQRLTLLAGIRADRSSANGDRDKRDVYPHASGSYRVTDLGDALHEGKIRGGFGKRRDRPRYG